MSYATRWRTECGRVYIATGREIDLSAFMLGLKGTCQRCGQYHGAGGFVSTNAVAGSGRGEPVGWHRETVKWHPALRVWWDPRTWFAGEWRSTDDPNQDEGGRF